MSEFGCAMMLNYLKGWFTCRPLFTFHTRAYDLDIKKHVCRRNKVQEYLVLAAYEQEIFWFRWDGSHYLAIEPDPDGVYRSQVFPGFWLHGSALWRDDLAALYATLNQGLVTAEHADFVAAKRAER